MYYALFDKQTGQHLHTGYNAESKKELVADYISYKSVDVDEEVDINKLSVKEVINIIEADEFVIETSKKKFPSMD